MANYVIRVALPEANDALRAALHVELAKYNISSGIKADDGKGYFLPDGEFCYSGEEAVNVVRDAVHRIAEAIQPGASVLVTEVVNVSWSGLKQV